MLMLYEVWCSISRAAVGAVPLWFCGILAAVASGRVAGAKGGVAVRLQAGGIGAGGGRAGAVERVSPGPVRRRG